jgi:hypothetical protein
MKAFLLLMGIFSVFFSSGRSQTKEVVVDLRSFACGHTKLGQPPDVGDFFAQLLKTSDVYKDSREGLEVGTKQGNLDYVFITIGAFQGSFARSGAKVALDRTTTPEQIKAEFGNPYWIDAKDNELIFFYEFDGGKIELQFEFPEKKTLGFITLMQDGVLSEYPQRRGYGVTKPWPPNGE